MSSIDSQIESSVEQLQMDESLRSNLKDDEAKALLDWATNRLTNCASSIVDEAIGVETVKNEFRRVRSMARNINTLFADDQNPEPQAALGILGLSPQADQIPPFPDRSAFIQWLIDQVTAAWSATSV